MIEFTILLNDAPLEFEPHQYKDQLQLFLPPTARIGLKNNHTGQRDSTVHLAPIPVHCFFNAITFGHWLAEIHGLSQNDAFIVYTIHDMFKAILRMGMSSNPLEPLSWAHQDGFFFNPIETRLQVAGILDDFRTAFDVASRHNKGPEFEQQPIRKRIDRHRLDYLDLELVTERGRPEAKVEWGKGAVKPIDNRITAWRVYHYVWLAEVRDEARLRQLLEVLKFQGMGKKHTAGFGKIHSYDIQPLPAGVNIEQKLFLERNGELILLRPLPYDAIMSASRRIVMTNLVIESGCGYQPPYWDKRRVVVREGTLFKFAT